MTPDNPVSRLRNRLTSLRLAIAGMCADPHDLDHLTDRWQQLRDETASRWGQA